MKEAYIAAKERWAAKMSGKARPAVRSTNRLPPGQREVHNFPVLDLGIRPDVPLDKWELKIGGHVENPVSLKWDQFAWKGAKFIREITFLDRDILGFWELRGYSNTADPWTEDRFS